MHQRSLIWFFLSESEVQILDFVTQQYKLFPYISMCFAFQFAASWLWDIYISTNDEMESGQLDNLPEVCMHNNFIL